MSVNKYLPHVLVLPEDDANRQIANGFVLGVRHGRQIQILPEVGGWTNVREIFLSQHVNGLRAHAGRHLVLLIDFDRRHDRDHAMTEAIPADILDRVFLLGTLSEPEDLRRAGLGSFEDIGLRMAQGCRDGDRTIWGHALLERNAPEIDRLIASVRRFLF